MNKTQLISRVYDQLKLQDSQVAKDTIKQAVELALHKITHELTINRETIKITNFGSFKVKEQAAKLAYNPTTGRKYFMPSKQKITFQADKCLLSL